VKTFPASILGTGDTCKDFVLVANRLIVELLLSHLRKNASHDAPVHVREPEVATLKAEY
jgi:hypothetical protein